MKTYSRSSGKATRIRNLGIRWRWMVSYTPRSFYPSGKSLR